MLPKTTDCAVADLATAGLDTVAIRVPAHPVARDILRAFGGPVVAPSANLSGHVSPTTAAHVQSDLAGRIDLIVDGGAVAVGVESTIVGCFDATDAAASRRRAARARSSACSAARWCSRPRMPTATAASRWRRACWPRITRRARRCGSMPKASSPARRCWRSASDAMPGVDAAAAVMNLSARGDLDEAAANLFGYLRALDAKGARAIAVMPIPHHGLGEAINDRLRRAAVGRE